MISATHVAAAANLVAAAADLAEKAGQTASAAPASGPARASSVPFDGPLPTKVFSGLTGLARARRPARSARSTRAARAAAGWAAAAAAKKTGSKTVSKAASKTASKSDPLSFLKDPNLSIEEKLIKLLGYLNQKWDKEMQDKLDKIGAGEGAQAASASTSSKKKKGGLFGSVAGALKSVLGPAGIALDALKIPGVRSMVGKIGGPVLAAAASAMGFPALAPLLLKAGPALVDAAAGLASSIDGAASGGGSTGSAAAASGTGTKKMTDSERQTLFMEIQRIQQKQQEMFSLVSNIIKANHEIRSSIINNIR